MSPELQSAEHRNIERYSAQYRSDGTVVPKELRKGVSAVTVQQFASQRSGVQPATNMEIPW
jgi:hypothetical protein